MWVTAVKRWDEVLTSILFALFGVGALLTPPRAQSTTPIFFAYLFNIEFILTGVILIIGTLTHKYYLRMLGYTLYIQALATIGGLIALTSQSPVALLCFAFATHGIFNIRFLRRDWKAKKNLAELIQHVEDKQGEG